MTYLFVLKNLKNYNWVYLLIVFNFASWFVNIELIEKKYENNNLSVCSTVHVTDAKIKFNFQPGYFEKYLKSRDTILCLIEHSKGSQKYNNISQGKKLLIK